MRSSGYRFELRVRRSSQVSRAMSLSLRACVGNCAVQGPGRVRESALASTGGICPCVRSLALVDAGQHFDHHGLLDCWAMATPSQMLLHNCHQLNASKMVAQKGDCRFACAELRRRNATLLCLVDFAEKFNEEEASVRLSCGSKSRAVSLSRCRAMPSCLEITSSATLFNRAEACVRKSFASLALLEEEPASRSLRRSMVDPAR